MDQALPIDHKLQILLDQASPDDLIDIIFILEASAVKSESLPIDPSDIMAGRKSFAEHAEKMLAEIIREASEHTGKTSADLKIFDHMASARLRASLQRVAARVL